MPSLANEGHIKWPWSSANGIPVIASVFSLFYFNKATSKYFTNQCRVVEDGNDMANQTYLYCPPCQ